MRDGAEDNPQGHPSSSRDGLLQAAHRCSSRRTETKYRDVKEYTAGELAALADETVISVPSAIVVAVTTKGFVISDDKNTDNIFVSDARRLPSATRFRSWAPVIRLAETRYGNRLRRGDGSVRRAVNYPNRRTSAQDRRLHLLQTGLRHRQGRFQRQHPHRFRRMPSTRSASWTPRRVWAFPP